MKSNKKFIIAGDVPQLMLDTFGMLKWTSIPVMIKKKILSEMKTWADQNLQLKDSTKKYESTGKKVIKADFEPLLLDLLNKYDWTEVSEGRLSEISDYLMKLFRENTIVKQYLKIA